MTTENHIKCNCLVDGARVQDLVGLTMFKYTQKGRKPELKVALIYNSFFVVLYSGMPEL